MYEKSGYIKLHRSFTNWEWYKNIVVSRVYLHLILAANFREDAWQGYTYKPGQIITSYQSLSEALALSVQQVRTALNHLKKTGYITIDATNRFSVITVANWEVYQNGTVASTYRPTSQTDTSCKASSQQIKNIKNIKNKEVYTRTQTRNENMPRVEYDFEQIRIDARKRIKEILREDALAKEKSE